MFLDETDRDNTRTGTVGDCQLSVRGRMFRMQGHDFISYESDMYVMTKIEIVTVTEGITQEY